MSSLTSGAVSSLTSGVGTADICLCTCSCAYLRLLLFRNVFQIEEFFSLEFDPLSTDEDHCTAFVSPHTCLLRALV